MKLKLKHIAPYLPYELNCEILDYQSDYVGIQYATIKGYYILGNEVYYNFSNGRQNAGKLPSQFKVFLRPLSDFIKEIDHHGEKFVPIDKIESINPTTKDTNPCVIMYDGSLEMQYYQNYELLFKWHFDVFGLIKKGLAVDIKNIKDK